MSEPAVDEASLLARAREGDLDAFAELVRRYEHRVRAVLFRLLDDDRDVEEATVFTWLYRIAVNEAFARLWRKRLPLAELDETERNRPRAADSAGDPQQRAEAVELQAFL